MVNPKTGEEQEEPGGVGAFLRGMPQGFSSSNVKSAQYNAGEQYLKVSYKNNSTYGYHGVSKSEASSLYGTGSAGGWVWDHLRKRGTKFGYQKPYAFISGQSPGYTPSYYHKDKDREWHRRIAPSGRDLEWTPATEKKVPMAEHATASESIKAPEKIPSASSTVAAPQRRTPGGSGIFSRIGRGIGSLFGSMFGGKHMAQGGEVPGDPSRGDNVPIRATAGEGVIPKEDWPLIEPIWRMLTGKRGGGGAGGHYALGGTIRNVAAMASRGYLGSQGGMLGGIAAAFGIPGGTPGVGQESPMNAAAEMLKDAARHLAEAAQHLGAPGPAAGTSLSQHQWLKNPAGNMQLVRRDSQMAQMAASGGEGAGAGAAGGAAGIALVAGAALLKLKDAAVGVTSLFKELTLNPAGVIRGVTGQFEGNVGKFNPAAIERFNFALDNVSAAAGRIFLPLIEKATAFANEVNVLLTDFKGFDDLVKSGTDGLRNFARAGLQGFLGLLTRITEAAQPLIQNFPMLGSIAGEATRTFFNLIKSGVSVIESMYKVGNEISKALGFADILTTATDNLKNFAATVATVAGVIEDAANVMRRGPVQNAQTITQSIGSLLRGDLQGVRSQVQGLGIRDPRQLFNEAMARMNTPSVVRGNMTFAAQPARQIGIEEIGQQARASAFSQGPNDPATQTADNTREMRDSLRFIATALRGMGIAIPQALQPPDPQMN